MFQEPAEYQLNNPRERNRTEPIVIPPTPKAGGKCNPGQFQFHNTSPRKGAAKGTNKVNKSSKLLGKQKKQKTAVIKEAVETIEVGYA